MIAASGAELFPCVPSLLRLSVIILLRFCERFKSIVAKKKTVSQFLLTRIAIFSCFLEDLFCKCLFTAVLQNVKK